MFFFGEGALIFITLIVVNWIIEGTLLFQIIFVECVYQALLVTFVFQLCLYFYDLYDLRMAMSISTTITRITQAFGVGCIVLAGIYYTLPEVTISTRIFWTSYFIICAVLMVWRAAYYLVVRRRMFVQEIVVVGTGTIAADIAREVEGKLESPYKIIGFVGEGQPAYNPNKVPVYPDLTALQDDFKEKYVEKIIIALDDRRGNTPMKELLDLKMQGVAIDQGVAFYENITGKLLAQRMDPSAIIFSSGFSLNRGQYLFKRFLDIVLSIALFVVTSPILIISAIVIWFESPGPVFYFQERVGEKGRHFRMIKFRSMREDAEKDGAVWARVDDDRTTCYGRFIRKLRIDELPQLWNVFKGEMSFVGPRPERPMFVSKLEKTIPYYNIRHDVKPGITGWAQVCYPYGASEEDALRKIEYDLYYMKNLSISLDLVVVFKTIKTVLFQIGSR